MKSATERIKCAAIRLRNGDVVESDNHREIRQLIVQGNEYCPVRGTDGFATETGRFVTRRRAAKIAQDAGQLREELLEPKLGLTSSDLW